MKRLITAVAIVMLLCASVMASGVGTEYMSKGMWRGFNVWGDDGIVRSYTETDVGPLDFAAAYWLPAQSGNEENQRLDGSLSYSGEVGNFAYVIGYGYYSFPDQSSHDAGASADLQEIFASVSYPIELLGLNLRPSYTSVQTWSSNSGQINFAQGALHIFGVRTQVLEAVDLGAEVVYNDGVEYQGRVDHDWSHAIFSAGLSIPITEKISFKPAAYYELACDQSVIEEDEAWFSLSIEYPF